METFNYACMYDASVCHFVSKIKEEEEENVNSEYAVAKISDVRWAE